MNTVMIKVFWNKMAETVTFTDFVNEREAMNKYDELWKNPFVRKVEWIENGFTKMVNYI